MRELLKISASTNNFGFFQIPKVYLGKLNWENTFDFESWLTFLIPRGIDLEQTGATHTLLSIRISYRNNLVKILLN